MADCSNLFMEFNQTIRLTEPKRENLKKGRDAIRDIVDGYIKENQPNFTVAFKEQGSFVMDTIINPIDCDYDLDDGVYLFNEDIVKWPEPIVVHRWVMKAVGKHTNIVKDKDTCIRVKYAADFHIDLPIYRYSFMDPELAHKVENWLLSNPSKFIEWFENKVNSGFNTDYLYKSEMAEQFNKWVQDMRKEDAQLRRIVRYLKAWAEFKLKGKFSGIVLTILAAENYNDNIEPDDLKFKNVLDSILSNLNKRFECLRPTTPEGENLLQKVSPEDQEFLLNELSEFVESARQALNHPNQNNACLKWQRHFGNRFPCHLAKDEIEGASEFSKPAFIRNTGRSANDNI